LTAAFTTEQIKSAWMPEAFVAGVFEVPIRPEVLRPLHSTATQRDLVVGATPRRIREMRVLHHRPGLAAVAAGRSMGEQTAVRQVDCLLTELLVVYGTCEN